MPASGVLDGVTELKSVSAGFVSITDPVFELREHAYHIPKNAGISQSSLYVGNQFERTVYQVRWSGGGGLTARIK